MTEVLQSSPSHFSSPSSSSDIAGGVNPMRSDQEILDQQEEQEMIDQEEEEKEEGVVDIERKEREREGDQLSLLTLLIAAFRRSIVGCSLTVSGSKELCNMEIGVPTNVRHVAHVTFDRFNGFLGLPVEFEPEVPRRAPSASATVFGVSTESMQLSYDSRGNSVPTILLMMQRRLYAQGGLQAEGIFRITAGNSQEEYVRDQLNRGAIPEGIDVHCLAGLIKAWFRELPTGILDSLSPEQVMQSHSEEECAQLARLLPPTEAALLDWAVNLMADVAQLEHINKMNARNIAMVFAPNMTQMSDPLTALMYAVQVMNFLKNLIIRALREREECVVESTSSHLKPTDDNGDLNASQPSFRDFNKETNESNDEEKAFTTEEPSVSPVESPLKANQDDDSLTDRVIQNFLTSIENIPGGCWSLMDICPCEVVSQVNACQGGFTRKRVGVQTKTCKTQTCQSSNLNIKRGSKTTIEHLILKTPAHLERVKSTGMKGRINPMTDKFEAWR